MGSWRNSIVFGGRACCAYSKLVGIFPIDISIMQSCRVFIQVLPLAPLWLMTLMLNVSWWQVSVNSKMFLSTATQQRRKWTTRRRSGRTHNGMIAFGCWSHFTQTINYYILCWENCLINGIPFHARYEIQQDIDWRCNHISFLDSDACAGGWGAGEDMIVLMNLDTTACTWSICEEKYLRARGRKVIQRKAM